MKTATAPDVVSPPDPGDDVRETTTPSSIPVFPSEASLPSFDRKLRLRELSKTFDIAFLRHRSRMSRLRRDSKILPLEEYMALSRECQASLRECIELQKEYSLVSGRPPLPDAPPPRPSLSAQLLTAQEEERRRLATELHDDFGQRLAVLSLQVTRALEGMAPEGPASQLLSEVSNGLARFATDLRALTHHLHPSRVDDLGLVASLQSLAADLRAAGVDITLSTPDTCPLRRGIALALYRTAQEAVQNAIRHAPGAPIHLQLSRKLDAVELKIRDAGPGFSPDFTGSRGLGLPNMWQRIHLLGGSFYVESSPGQGTLVKASCPTLLADGRD